MLQVTNERLLPLTDFQPSPVKFVAIEFVTSMPPLSNANYLGYKYNQLWPGWRISFVVEINNKHIFIIKLTPS